ncbi:MAG: branched-chain amino acid transporter rane protein [Oscillospiraceae bacterium]|nr:branched-chain amino acid transporter rane protein [Oscillospiraceae bacterium]
MTVSILTQALIDGILIGGVYAVIGLGLSLAYGVMGVVNWAHGEVLMVSMYISYYLTKFAGFDPYLTALVNILVLGVVGFILQKYIFNRLINRGKAAWRDILLFTAGMSMALQALFNLLFGAEVKSVETRYSGMLELGNMLVSVPKLISFLLAALCCAGLYVFIQKSEMGRALRATSQDRITAQLMSINANLVYCVAFVISLGIVGLSGALLTPFYSVNPYVGVSFCFKAFIIVAMGGKGNIPGAMLSGVIIGVIEKLGGAMVGDNLAQIFIFVLFILILLVKPEGILEKRVRG